MNINYFKNTILSVLGLFMAFSAISMNKVVPDDEMHYSTLHTTAGISSDWYNSNMHYVYNREDLVYITHP